MLVSGVERSVSSSRGFAESSVWRGCDRIGKRAVRLTMFLCARVFFASSHAPMAGGQNGNWKDTLVVPPKDERYRTEVSNCREFSRNLAEI